MNIENSIFKKCIPDFDKLSLYGFILNNNHYKYTKNIIKDSFRMEVIISKDGLVSGKVYDIELNDE